jgi:hypothetical protein
VPVKVTVYNYDEGEHTITAPGLGLNALIKPGTEFTTPPEERDADRAPEPGRPRRHAFHLHRREGGRLPLALCASLRRRPEGLGDGLRPDRCRQERVHADYIVVVA